MLGTNKNWGRGELHSNLFESVFVQCGQAFNLNAGLKYVYAKLIFTFDTLPSTPE